MGEIDGVVECSDCLAQRQFAALETQLKEAQERIRVLEAALDDLVAICEDEDMATSDWITTVVEVAEKARKAINKEKP